MPLSDHEREVLAAMEAALEKEDPKLVSALNTLPKGGKGLGLGALAFLIGMGTLIAGLITKSVLLGAIGFLVALAGVILVIYAIPRVSKGTPGSKGALGKSWSDRMQERWDKRDSQ